MILDIPRYCSCFGVAFSRRIQAFRQVSMQSRFRQIPFDWSRPTRWPVAHALIAAVGLFMVAAPVMAGTVPFEIDESKSPLETEDESRPSVDDGMTCCQGRFSSRRISGGPRTNVQQDAHADHLNHSIRSYRVEGHRMSNGDLAPLTC